MKGWSSRRIILITNIGYISLSSSRTCALKGWSSRSNRPPCAFPPGAFCFPASHTFDHFPHTFATSAFDVTPFASCSARSLYVRRRFPIRFLCESIHSIKQARQYTQQHNTTAHQCSPRYNNTHSKVTVISPVPLPAPLLLSPRSPRVLRREGSTPWRQCGIPPGIDLPAPASLRLKSDVEKDEDAMRCG